MSLILKSSILFATLFFSIFANAQNTYIYQQEILIPADNKPLRIYEEKFEVRAADLEGEYFLRIEPTQSLISIANVIINGAKVNNLIPIYGHNSNLIPIQLKSTNQIKVQLLGRPGTGIRLTFLDLKKTIPISASFSFTKKKNPAKESVQVSAPFGGIDYIMVLESQNSDDLKQQLSHVSLNGKSIFSPVEMLFARNSKIVKVVTLQDTNDLTVKILSPRSPGLKIDFLGIAQFEENVEEVSPGTLTFQSLNSEILNSRSNPVIISVQNATLDQNSAEVEVFRNGQLLLNPQVSVSGNSIRIDNLLVSGFNSLSISTYDNEGRTLSIEGEFWTGDNSVRVFARKSMERVSAEGKLSITDKGRFKSIDISIPQAGLEISNLPSEIDVATFLQANTSTGTAIFQPNQTQEVLVDLEESPPATFPDNNEFSDGLNGWSVLKGTSELIQIPNAPEQESARGFNILSTLAPAPEKLALALTPTYAWGFYPNTMAYTAHVKRTLEVPANLRAVIVKFKFLGSKNPYRAHATLSTLSGKYSKFSYRLDAHSKIDFDSEWNYSILYLNGQSETVLLNAYVEETRNWDELSIPFGRLVIDGIYYQGLSAELKDSALQELSFNGEKTIKNKIRFISLDGSNRYCGFSIPIDLEELIVYGPKGDFLTGVSLRLYQNGTLKARGRLTANDRTNEFLSRFGDEEKLILKAHNPNTLLNYSRSCFDSAFSIDSTPLTIDPNAGKNISADLKLETQGGAQFILPIDGSYSLLSRFKWGERFSDNRDWHVGGDDWAQPHVIEIVNRMIQIEAEPGKKFNLTVNDFSNMHGGLFAPHKLHDRGLSADARVTGFPLSPEVNKPCSFAIEDQGNCPEPGASAAGALLGLFLKMAPEDLAKIEYVIVTYRPNSEFRSRLVLAHNNGIRFNGKSPLTFFRSDFEKLRKAEINRLAKGIYKRLSGHRDHFHIEFKE